MITVLTSIEFDTKQNDFPVDARIFYSVTKVFIGPLMIFKYKKGHQKTNAEIEFREQKRIQFNKHYTTFPSNR